MRLTHALLATLLALPLASCQDASAPTAVNPEPAFVPAPSFALVQNEWVPLDQVTYNVCDGEDVHWVGKILYVTSVTNDGAGGYHYVSNRNWQAVGTGLTSGDTYRANFPRNISYLFRGPFPEIYTVTWDNYIAKQGVLGGYLLRTSQKIVVNGNGEVVLDTSDYEFVCKGQ